jgi:alpha-beta hydrolase superfamily lysophospholipase
MKRKRILWFLAIAFIAVNVISFFHAWQFTHFDTDVKERTKDAKELSFLAKANVLFTGVDNPRPVNKKLPARPFTSVKIKSSELLDCWYIPVDSAKATMIMFHGFAGEKSSLLERAEEIVKLGYNVFLVDFAGSGGSGGNSTSIGYHEAQQVKDVFEFVKQNYPGNIFLFGTSMGSAAILKAIDDNHFDVKGIVIECPFGSLYKTVGARFKMMGVPSFPMASFLCFWGGVINGYWAFSHNPSEYAKGVSSPTLLLYGQQDERVTQEETDLIFENLSGEKTVKNYPGAGHDVFIESNREEWAGDVREFLGGR